MIGGDSIVGSPLDYSMTTINLPGHKKKQFKVAVEGNIASGKSTLLSKLQLMNSVEVLVEPVSKWQNLSGGNLIGHMYEDAERWGYLFQSYVLLTMMDLHHKSVNSQIVMLERSVYSARYCFVENLHKNGILNDMEFSCYCQWFDYVIKQNPPKLDLVVYLRSSPEVCYQRLQERGRAEEKPVTLVSNYIMDFFGTEYLQSLHARYEDWLGNDKHHSWHGNVPVLVIDANEDSKKNSHVFSKHCTSILERLDNSQDYRTISPAR